MAFVKEIYASTKNYAALVDLLAARDEWNEAQRLLATETKAILKSEELR